MGFSQEAEFFNSLARPDPPSSLTLRRLASPQKHRLSLAKNLWRRIPLLKHWRLLDLWKWRATVLCDADSRR
jgi:hypothetical protein